MLKRQEVEWRSRLSTHASKPRTVRRCRTSLFRPRLSNLPDRNGCRLRIWSSVVWWSRLDRARQLSCKWPPATKSRGIEIRPLRAVERPRGLSANFNNVRWNVLARVAEAFRGWEKGRIGGKKERKEERKRSTGRGKRIETRGWNGGAWKEEERTRCRENERLDTLLSMGLRQIHIATYISRLGRGSMRRCRGGVGSRPGTARRKMPPIACTPMIYLITGRQTSISLDRRSHSTSWNGILWR